MADNSAISAAELQRRLADTAAPADPLDVTMPPNVRFWPAGLRERISGTLRPAGVLIPVIDRTETLSVLLTQRAAELTQHAGQVSFPGGRMEHGDADIVATALRETREEIGIGEEQVSVIGFLPPMPTITGFAVTSVIGIVPGGVELELDTTEVEYTFEVPLPFLLDPRNHRLVERDFKGRKVPQIEFHYAGERIWGATAYMMHRFIKTISKE